VTAQSQDDKHFKSSFLQIKRKDTVQLFSCPEYFSPNEKEKNRKKFSPFYILLYTAGRWDVPIDLILHRLLTAI
jgi:hypothetical protein